MTALGVGVTLAMCVVAALPGEHVATAHSLELPLEHARAIEGGVGADIVWPSGNNYGQSYDNLRFQVSIDGSQLSGNQVDIRAYAEGEGGAGKQTVALNGSGMGTYHRRTFWPYGQGQKFDLVMQWYDTDDSSWYDCLGVDPDHTDQYLFWNVKVHEVEVHNTKESSGGYQTTWSQSDIDSIIDRSSTAIPGANSNTIDGIYGQCGAMQANGTDKTQWRRHGIDTVTIPAGCSDLSEEFGPGCATTQALENCANAMMDAASHGTNNYNAHVYVVDELGCTQGSVTAGAATLWITDPNSMAMPPDNKRLWIVFADQLDPSSDENTASVLLAHELGHATSLNHYTSGDGNCDQGTDYPVKNLMCPDLGRKFNDAQGSDQCDKVRNNTPYLDRN